MRQEVLCLKGVTRMQKAGVHLQDINLRLFKGELVALLGPNGVGKTSLLKIICGMTPYDAGEILFHGKTAQEGNACKIMYFPGNGGYIDSLDEVENIFLKKHQRFLIHKKREKAVLHLMEQEYGITVADKRSGHYDIGDRKLIRLFSILREKPEICLIDEPLAYLNIKQKETFCLIIERALKMGISILVSAHDLDFAISYASRSYILYDNRIVRCVNHEDENLWEIYHKMMDNLSNQPESRGGIICGKEILSVQKLGGKKTIKQFNFSLYRGECVGITGGEDLQRKLLMKLLAGIEEKTSGEICCKGKSIKKHSLYEMRRRGIVYLPNTEDALIDHMKVSDYVVLNSMKRVSYLGCVNEKLVTYVAKYYINQVLGKAYDSEIEYLNRPIEKLSFGTRKIIRLAQGLCQDPEILLIDSPTSGLDMKIKQNVRNIFCKLKASGKTILINPTDDDDLTLCDRYIGI